MYSAKHISIPKAYHGNSLLVEVPCTPFVISSDMREIMNPSIDLNSKRKLGTVEVGYITTDHLLRLECLVPLLLSDFQMSP